MFWVLGVTGGGGRGLEGCGTAPATGSQQQVALLSKDGEGGGAPWRAQGQRRCPICLIAASAPSVSLCSPEAADLTPFTSAYGKEF